MIERSASALSGGQLCDIDHHGILVVNPGVASMNILGYTVSDDEQTLVILCFVHQVGYTTSTVDIGEMTTVIGVMVYHQFIDKYFTASYISHCSVC